MSLPPRSRWCSKSTPKVVDAVVIGLPDPDWGHRIHAIVETNAPLGSKELIRFALNYLPPYKIPKSIEFIGSHSR